MAFSRRAFGRAIRKWFNSFLLRRLTSVRGLLYIALARWCVCGFELASDQKPAHRSRESFNIHFQGDYGFTRKIHWPRCPGVVVSFAIRIFNFSSGLRLTWNTTVIRDG
jgi:hypothetical protein